MKKSDSLKINTGDDGYNWFFLKSGIQYSKRALIQATIKPTKEEM